MKKKYVFYLIVIGKAEIQDFLNSVNEKDSIKRMSYLQVRDKVINETRKRGQKLKDYYV